MTEWIATAIGVIGSIGGIGTILYWRQNKGSATAGERSRWRPYRCLRTLDTSDKALLGDD